MSALPFALLSAVFAAALSADPLVTLNHGGQLRGKSFDYNSLNIDLFLGVPFATPPTGDLRFHKPRPAKAWAGIKDAVTPGNFCLQKPLGLATGGNRMIGNEDCLYLDITVPGGVSTSTKKPVMVWIHGGGYIIGSKDDYPGATIAKHGDVIVVTINYRLGVLGFLSNGAGTGNYGLWDQREALVWLQDNIAAFGGDPDMITIFGESAGAGSAAALMLSQHTDGLFKRAIQESGSMFVPWGWFSSERGRHDLIELIKKQGSCSSEEAVYDCLRKKTSEEIIALTPSDIGRYYLHPEPDEDFFAADIVNESYVPSQRFDLLAGFNKQEMVGAVFLPTLTKKSQEPIDDGLSMHYVELVLTDVCSEIAADPVDSCMAFYIDQYGLNSTQDGIERALRLSSALGELNFNADTVRELIVHSQGPKSTYAYQFSESLLASSSTWAGEPTWAKHSATHGEEIPFVFGAIHNKENKITNEYVEPDGVSALPQVIVLMNSTTADDKALTDLMLTMWTNFAKSGNPNKPQSLPAGIPQWPEFDKDNNQFMELNSTDTRVITTPHKDRINNVLNTIFTARAAYVKADVVEDKAKEGAGRDAVVG